MNFNSLLKPFRMSSIRSRSKGRRAINEINMVPFVDLILVLLIMFMVTAPAARLGVVDLPSVGKTNAVPKRWRKSSWARRELCS